MLSALLSVKKKKNYPKEQLKSTAHKKPNTSLNLNGYSTACSQTPYITCFVTLFQRNKTNAP